MTTEHAPVDPNRLTPEQAAKLLSAGAKVRIPVEQIAAGLEAGAPRNAGHEVLAHPGRLGRDAFQEEDLPVRHRPTAATRPGRPAATGDGQGRR